MSPSSTASARVELPLPERPSQIESKPQPGSGQLQRRVCLVPVVALALFSQAVVAIAAFGYEYKLAPHISPCESETSMFFELSDVINIPKQEILHSAQISQPANPVVKVFTLDQIMLGKLGVWSSGIIGVIRQCCPRINSDSGYSGWGFPVIFNFYTDGKGLIGWSGRGIKVGALGDDSSLGAFKSSIGTLLGSLYRQAISIDSFSGNIRLAMDRSELAVGKTGINRRCSENKELNHHRQDFVATHYVLGGLLTLVGIFCCYRAFWSLEKYDDSSFGYAGKLYIV